MSLKDEPDMLRSVFDALPSMVFVVDNDMRIHEYNAAAADLLKTGRKTFLKQRTGDVLYCLHAAATRQGCGRAPFCKDCIIRQSVMEAFGGNRVFRRRTRMELLRDGEKSEIYALITASPFRFRQKDLVLLVIEDIREIAELRRLIPICGVCKKIRDEKQFWMRFEAYFKENWDVDFSHGLCPDCYEIQKAQIQKEIDAQRNQSVSLDDEGPSEKVK